MSSEFIAKLDKRDPEVYQGFEVFENFYGNSFKRTTISQIIDGENIQIKPENIRVDEPVDESVVPVEIIDQLYEKYCNKKLYEYQRQAILKILELEEKQEHIDPVTGHTIVHNSISLNLPIGSGKSLIFMSLALFFKSVKIHPIIVSTDGRFINEFEQVPFENYPFYYENSAYDKETVNAVMAIKTDLQRQCTVILTYSHLLDQLKQYFIDDYKKSILNQKKIVYVNYRGINHEVESNIDKIDILIVVSDEYNVNKLVELSYQKPFARVIIDDYTNMSDLSRMRQILTYSFIPVSGSGFEKSINEIPSSYYSLKNIPYEKIKLVGDPEKTYEGVMRSNIITGEILTSKSEFDVYNFVSIIEEMVKKLPECEKETPSSLFEEIRNSSVIENFIKYGFFIQNIASFKSMIPSLILDIQAGQVDVDKVSNFIDWFNNTKDEKFKRLICSPIAGAINKSVSTLVNNPCIICKDTKDKHYGFGVISSCCGAFICSRCIDKAATKSIINSQTLEKMISPDYYCVCCREKNPRYYFNSTQHSSSNETRSYLLAEQFFDVTNCHEHYSIDYYFYMLKNGWKMRDDCCNGKDINIYQDISQGLIDSNVFKIKTIPVIEKIKNGDLLFPQILTAIYNTYTKIGIKPVDNSILLVYKCKDILQQRIRDRFDDLRSEKGSPFEKVKLLFRDTVGSVIGLSMNIMGIIVYDKSNEEVYSMLQLIGRLLRISSYGQKILFYVENNVDGYI